MDIKEKLLDDLYSLRAGLTLIALEKDKYDAVGNKLIKDEQELYKANFRTVKPSGSLASEEGRKDYVLDLNKYKQRQKSEIASQRLSNFFSILRFLLIPICVIVIALGVWLILWAVKKSNSEFERFGVFWYVFMFAGLFVIITGIVCLVYAIKYVCAEFDFDIFYIFNCKRDIRESNLDLKTMKRVENECYSLEEKAFSIRANIKELAKKIYAIYYRNYYRIIDERDWQYLDMVIYYLQTGRADTLKEALQQVDRYSQTEAILKELEYATKAICHTIELQIDRVVSKLDKIIEQNKVMISQNEIMISQNEMQIALLDKMSKSSTEIVSEVRVIVN